MEETRPQASITAPAVASTSISGVSRVTPVPIPPVTSTATGARVQAAPLALPPPPSQASTSSNPHKKAQAADNGARQRFSVELKTGETTIVSCKKLLKDSGMEKPLKQDSRQDHAVDLGPQPGLSAPFKQGENDPKEAPSNRVSSVIEKIERFYMGKNSSDEEEEFDDTELDEYFQADNLVTKSTGYLVNKGQLEHIMTNSRAKMKNKMEEKSDKYYESMDPIYKIFLDHLKSDGTSYILEMVDTELGVPVYLKYEGHKTSCNKPRSKSLKKVKRKESVHIAPLFEESYERFFKNLKFEEEIMILDLGGGRNIVYEEDRTNVLDNVRDENCMDPNEQALVPHINASGSNGEKNELTMIAADSQTFDEKLAAVVRKPFNECEYEALMNEAIRRKPMMKQRNLRNMSKRYRTHQAGMSYFDYYPDLAAQIAEANKYQRLILLRKFFFWLENLCHDGAYMPWIPKSLTDKPVFNEELEN